MINHIELVINTNRNRTSHLLCEDCTTELDIVLDQAKLYKNPMWTIDWDISWHEFNSVRFIFPELIFQLFGEWEDIHKIVCPYCSCKGKIVAMEKGLFDLKLIKNSLHINNSDEYKCANCEKVYASQKCVCRIGRNYICGDCAAFA